MKSLLSFGAALALLASLAGPVAAQPARQWSLPSAWAPRPAGEKPSPLLGDPRALEAFLKRELGDKLARDHIAGAVFVAVKDGRIMFQKGYGYADIAARRPVDPARTLFYVASISKIMLGTAVMRMVEHGDLSLDADVTRLDPDLDLQRRLIPGQRLTLRTLLTHSSGFQEIFLDSSVSDPREFPRAGPFVRKLMPPQGVPQGSFISYSDAGIAAAGAVVEKVAHAPLEDVLQRQVFGPLGMTQAVLDIPLNPRARQYLNDIVTTYVWSSARKRLEAQQPVLRLDYPASSVAMSGAAAARFLTVFLNHGTIDGHPFLTPETVAAMTANQAWSNPRVPGFGITFKEGMRNGVRYVGHSGDYRGDESMLTFFPAYGFGFFISYTGGTDTFYRDLFDHLMDEAFPLRRETVRAMPGGEADAAKLAGQYVDFRFHIRDPMDLVWPLLGTMRVSADGDGLLDIVFPSYYFRGGHTKYVEVSPDLYRIVDRGAENSIGPTLTDYLVVRRDAGGKPIGLATTIQNHPIVLAPVAWVETTSGILTVWAAILAGALLPVLVGLIWGALRLVRRTPLIRTGGAYILAGALLSAAAVLGFLGFFYGVLLNVRPAYNLTFGLGHLGVTWVLFAPYIAVLAAILSAVGIAGVLREKGADRRLGIGLAAVSLCAAAAFVVLCAYFHVFEFALRGGAAG